VLCYSSSSPLNLVNQGKTFLAELHKQAPTLIHALGSAGVNLGKVSSHAAGAEALQESLTEYFGGIIEQVRAASEKWAGQCGQQCILPT
jgi:hypothetical protein